jgi:hypothetical protein
VKLVELRPWSVNHDWGSKLTKNFENPSHRFVNCWVLYQNLARVPDNNFVGGVGTNVLGRRAEVKSLTVKRKPTWAKFTPALNQKGRSLQFNGGITLVFFSLRRANN